MRRVAMAISFLWLVAAGCGSEPAELSGFVREPIPVVADAALPDAAAGGAPFAMQAPEGGLLIVYFGYTSCPDVCPTTLAEVRSALEDLGDDAGRVEVAMVTVDPARDSDEIVAGYVHSFVPGSHALRTEDDSMLSEVADAFGAYYEVTVGSDGGVEVVHTGHLYAVDDRGRLRVTWPFGVDGAALAADLEILLEG